MGEVARTLGDLRRGLCRVARPPRDPACDESDRLWWMVGLPENTPIGVLLERWTPLAACMLARADGIGPRVGAVAWVERGLGTAVLIGADLNGANLRGADLSGVDLYGANLRCANLRNANMRCADLNGANLQDADLSRADLNGARTHGANLHGADLSGAYRPEGGVDGWEPDSRGRLRRAGGDGE